VINFLAQAMTAAPIVPPRPNLGPEPMLAPAPSSRIVLGFAAALVVGSLIVWRMRRRHKPRARSLTSDASQGQSQALPDAPRLQFIIFAEMLRRALVARFGPHWQAKTTEEICSEADLAALLGPERRGQLARLLHIGDRAKFAWELDEQDQGEEWARVVSALVDAIAPAGATSTIKGK
jgi:hypothetical protein